jgi:hypothetical protein
VKAKLREDRIDASRINETRAMDFVHDQLATGRESGLSNDATAAQMRFFSQ